MRFRHVALLVPELRAAEDYYTSLFGMGVLFREAPQEPGGPDAELWATLPQDRGWDEAEASGIALGMVALQRDDVVLALLAGEPTGMQIYTLGFTMGHDELALLRSRLAADTVVESDAEGWLAFVDRFGVRWQLSESAGFGSSGESRGRWLDLDQSQAPGLADPFGEVVGDPEVGRATRSDRP